MKIVADFSMFARSELGEEIFERLSFLLPECLLAGFPQPMLCLRLYTTDPRYPEVKRLFESNGFTPYQQRSKPRGPRRPNEHYLIFRKEYEPSDYETAPLLQPSPPNEARFPHWIHSDHQLLVGIEANRIGNTSAMGAEIAALPGDVGELIVRPTLKRQIETAGMKHLVFRELPLFDERESVPWPDGSRWAVGSDLTLPPVLANPTPAWDDPRPQELRYRQSSLSELPDFDLAQTHEKHAGVGALVASKRFYRFCLDLGIEMGWYPVAIEQE